MPTFEKQQKNMVRTVCYISCNKQGLKAHLEILLHAEICIVLPLKGIKWLLYTPSQ